MRGGTKTRHKRGDDGQKLTFSLVPLHTRSICTPDLRSPPKGVPHPLPRRSRRRLTRVCVIQYILRRLLYTTPYILHMYVYTPYIYPFYYPLITPYNPPLSPCTCKRTLTRTYVCAEECVLYLY